MIEDAPEIVKLVRCAPETPRHCIMKPKSLSEIREAVENHIRNTYLKQVQAPIGMKPVLKAWMELN